MKVVKNYTMSHKNRTCSYSQTSDGVIRRTQGMGYRYCCEGVFLQAAKYQGVSVKETK